MKEDDNSCQVVSKENEEDAKKRPLSLVKDEEPWLKELFGSEDVDLRQLIPPVLAVPNLPDDDIAPPPPSINIANEIARDANENWDNLKTESNKNSTIKTAKSSLEDVRKLAKTAKLSKLSKLDKLTRDIDHRNKLSELQMADDTQEANDEKIRTMITPQAQELLESNSISQEQYKHLIKTVMSINETNKLKEAKRRESLNAIKQKLTAINDDDSHHDTTERNLAMQAVLKKRIPKLNKAQSLNEQNSNTDSQQADSNTVGNSEDLPHNEDKKQDSNEEQTSTMQATTGRAIRGQRENVDPKCPRGIVLWIHQQLAICPWDRVDLNNALGFIQWAPQAQWHPAVPWQWPTKYTLTWPMSGGNMNNMSGPPQFGKAIWDLCAAMLCHPWVHPSTSHTQTPQFHRQSQEDLVRTITIRWNR
ncbi:hypothetical protein EVAR_74100_1 [Eumeta japonica]|uniref:Uncharacterized protein n=1 Tax=Eumeta variegata TaxID=151549 RepID=A0A4C1SWU6_EUMVA|nr:hypothetical protein EVAR_74100_1 [Eumeta japonica]